VAPFFVGKTVAIVGSGPGSLRNPLGLVDSHDTVVRVNNYKLLPQTGKRTDVFYSFFGTSIRKAAEELIRDGVKLCFCKCPDAKFMESEWHRRRGKENGVDFRGIYARRAGWWPCDVYIPSVDEFLAHFTLLGGHVPTTGFAAILDVLSFGPKRVYLTGFDFFQSAVHNVNERWRKGDPTDPIGHVPGKEREWFATHMKDMPVSMDDTMRQALKGHVLPQRPMPSWKAEAIARSQRARQRRLAHPR
jgi:hypothetical protein